MDQVRDLLTRYKNITTEKKSTPQYKGAFTKKLKASSPFVVFSFVKEAKELNYKGTRSEEQMYKRAFGSLQEKIESLGIQMSETEAVA